LYVDELNDDDDDDDDEQIFVFIEQKPEPLDYYDAFREWR